MNSIRLRRATFEIGGAGSLALGSPISLDQATSHGFLSRQECLIPALALTARRTLGDHRLHQGASDGLCHAPSKTIDRIPATIREGKLGSLHREEERDANSWEHA